MLEEIENLSTSTVQKTNQMHVNSLSLSKNVVNNSTLSVNVPCFKEVRSHWVKQYIKGKNNVFNRFSCGQLRDADVLSSPLFFSYLAVYPNVL